MFGKKEKVSTIRMPKILEERLLEIQEATGVGSIAEVLKDAVIIYDVLVKEHAKGNSVFVRDATNGTEKEHPIFE